MMGCWLTVSHLFVMDYGRVARTPFGLEILANGHSMPFVSLAPEPLLKTINLLKRPMQWKTNVMSLRLLTASRNDEKKRRENNKKKEILMQKYRYL